jgi:hypothetical protein
VKGNNRFLSVFINFYEFLFRRVFDFILKYDECESQIEVISKKLQIQNLNDNDKNVVELVNKDSQIEMKAENKCITAKVESANEEPYLHSSMNCLLEIKYTDPVARGQLLCRTMKRNFCVKFLQIITLTSLEIKDFT